MLNKEIKQEILNKKIQQTEIQLYNYELQLIASKAAGDRAEVQKNVKANISKLKKVIEALNKELETL